MRLRWLIVYVLASIFSFSVTEASFRHDVAKPASSDVRQITMEDALLAKATPLEDYKTKLATKGLRLQSNGRRLEDAGSGDQDGDDYYLDADYMYSFSGYSLKYAKCQPVQRFSEDAIQAGEYTPMVTDDIVILRLCPYRFCSASQMFGCHYNYAEYAIDLSDYIRVMLKYKDDKLTQLCEWCENCYARRRLNDGNNNGGDQDDDDNNQGQNDDGQNNAYYAADDDGGNNQYYYGDDAVNYQNDECYNYQSYCTDDNGYSLCQDADDDDDTYLDAMDYLDYLYCARISDDENYNYYVQPRCDGYDGTIKMAIFHDAFCSQYAGNEVSLKNFGLGFQESIFEEFYDAGTCLDCSASNYPPYFNANSNMCNRMHISGARCSSNMQYDLFEADEDESTECSFIESVRFGTYDETGQLYLEGSAYRGAGQREVTSGQKVGLAISIGLCAVLALYSCYLHHSITNLLIKSLSHTDLLPPSRHKSGRRSNSKSKRRSRKSARVADDDDDDWDIGGTPA